MAFFVLMTRHFVHIAFRGGKRDCLWASVITSQGKKIVGDDRPSLHFSALFLFITPSRVMEAVHVLF